MGKEERGNQKRAVETRKNVGFSHPRIHLQEVEGGSGKVHKIYKAKVSFLIPKFCTRGQKGRNEDTFFRHLIVL